MPCSCRALLLMMRCFSRHSYMGVDRHTACPPSPLIKKPVSCVDTHQVALFCCPLQNGFRQCVPQLVRRIRVLGERGGERNSSTIEGARCRCLKSSYSGHDLPLRFTAWHATELLHIVCLTLMLTGGLQENHHNQELFLPGNIFLPTNTVSNRALVRSALCPKFISWLSPSVICWAWRPSPVCRRVRRQKTAATASPGRWRLSSTGTTWSSSLRW